MKLLVFLLLVGVSLAAQKRPWTPSNPRSAKRAQHGPLVSAREDAVTDDLAAREREGVAFLAELDKLSSEQDTKVVRAEWGYESNITAENLEHKVYTPSRH